MKQSFGFCGIFSKVMILALLGWAIFPADPVLAKIYKYKDEKGITHFTDDPGKIPRKYRDQGSVKKFRGVAEPTPDSGLPQGFPGQTDSGSKQGQGAPGEADGILSAEEKALVEQTILVFQTGVALANRYKDAVPSASNGRGVTIAIQGALPVKQNLAGQLKGTQVPELKEALGFLTQSIAEDEKDRGIGAGLKTRIVSIMDRVQNEGRKQTALIQMLEKALKESEKKKLEAKIKKEAEAKQKK